MNKQLSIIVSPVTKHFPVACYRYMSHVTVSLQVTGDMLMKVGGAL